MIRVHVKERPREFDVYLGSKRVGKVKAYNHGSVEAHVVDKDAGGGFRFICYEASIRRAMQTVLVAAGFGKSGPGFKVTETKLP